MTPQPTQSAEIEAFSASLRLLAKDVVVKELYWLDGESEDFCRDCALLEIEMRNMREGGEPPLLDGGWGGQEEDGCRHCARCGIMLDYSLTDYGVKAEIDHFLRDRDDGPLTAEDAAHLNRVFDAMIYPLEMDPRTAVVADLLKIRERYASAVS